MALKIAAIVFGCFLLLYLGFIQPARNADPGLVGVIALLGTAVSGGVGFMAIRGLLRAERRKEAGHD